MAISIDSLAITRALRAKLSQPTEGHTVIQGAEYLPRTVDALKARFGLTNAEARSVINDLRRIGLHGPPESNEPSVTEGDE